MGTGTQDAPAAQRTFDAAANAGHSKVMAGSSMSSGNKQSETVAAPHAARSGVLSTVESVAEKAIPWALDAFEDLKRSETEAHAARSSILSEIGHGLEDIAPFAISALSDLKRSETESLAARSSILSEIGHGLEDIAPFAISALSDLKRSETVDAPFARRSSEILHDIESVGGTALKVLGGLFEDE
ncbi:hypothetical protein BD289DRAFT_432487 [Coniella lustricola]|uniref:Uncharacterized protein n=1 Tax=Coniella lustricola TaxID=2025994 RepID=A0A2T3A9R4_9PEZI|nr:hypothetical protein BD289DRAFT_432487 [Coniella lustricola]